jgi:hypothetical protein
LLVSDVSRCLDSEHHPQSGAIANPISIGALPSVHMRLTGALSGRVIGGRIPRVKTLG